MTPDENRKLAIAVVTRDRPDVLQRFAFPSLVVAAEAGWDVLVVDQSAGNETAEIVRAAPRIRYLRSAPGLSVGRNLALESADTTFIAFVDDDASFAPTWAESMVAAFARDEHAGAVCGRGRTPDGRLLPGRDAGVYHWPTNPFGLGSGFNLAVRRDAARRVGGFDERLGAGASFKAAEDTDMLYRLLRAGWSVVCTDDADVIHHDWRPRSLERSLHYGYGLGAGAQIALHKRAGDAEALRVARWEVTKHVVALARGVVTLQPRVVAHQPPFLAGMLAGYVRAMRS